MRNALRFPSWVLAAAALVALPAPPVRAELSVDVSFFHDDLAPYGRWIDHREYGECWVPRVRVGWRPYLDGRWIFTEYGWMWVSEEPWGWAPFHYGRWFLDPHEGWVWVPGRDWAPAWVTWRYGDGYVGWAPLPPRVRWVAGIGLDLGGLDLEILLAPSVYTFVPEGLFIDSNVRRHAVPPGRNPFLFRNTRDHTRYSGSGRFVMSHGVPIETIERATRRSVPRWEVREARERDSRGTRTRGHEVTVYRPEVTPDRARRREPERREDRAEPREPARREEDKAQERPREEPREPEAEVPSASRESPSRERAVTRDREAEAQRAREREEAREAREREEQQRREQARERKQEAVQERQKAREEAQARQQEASQERQKARAEAQARQQEAAEERQKAREEAQAKQQERQKAREEARAKEREQKEEKRKAREKKEKEELP